MSKKLTTFERRLKGMPSVAVDVFTDFKKAVWTAKGRWAEDPDPGLWELFVVKYGGETVIKKK